MQLERIHILEYLTELGIAFEPTGDDRLKLCCPFHDDNSPSMVLDLEHATFKCHATSCNQYGSAFKLLHRLTERGTERRISPDNFRSVLAKRYNITDERDHPINADSLELAHAAIWAPNPLKKVLNAKGISDETIRRYRLGYEAGRITIPIKDINDSVYVNVRKYLPGAAGGQKMRNLKGRSEPQVYPSDQLQYDVLVLCGGEAKALAALERLNPAGIGAVCLTASEGQWNDRFTDRFKDKTVYICMDIDEAGLKAARKLGLKLASVTNDLHTVQLPLSLQQYPTGDINDYVILPGANLQKVLVENSSPFRLKVATGNTYTEGEYVQRTLSSSVQADNIQQRSTVRARVEGLTAEKYAIPRTVLVTCAKDKEFCPLCPVNRVQGKPVFEVPKEAPAILALQEASSEQVERILRKDVIGIPSKCKANTLQVCSYYSVDTAMLAPPAELRASNSNDERPLQKALMLGSVTANEEYKFLVRTQPSPKTQEAVLIATEALPTSNQLDSYCFGPDQWEQCRAFQPADDSVEALAIKLGHIYHDLSHNVTHIYGRPEIHLAVDLAYHSPLHMRFDEHRQDPTHGQKAYMEVLIIGDSGCGKSHVTQGLQEHYNLGHLIDCASITEAGLIGGCQQVGSKWFITWGAWPANDRRLIILEELKECLKGSKAESVLPAIKETRSSGKARINKVVKGERPARARLIATTNTLSGRALSTYSTGIESVAELIKNAEDIRRFDYVLGVSREDLDKDEVHRHHRAAVPHTYTKDLCHMLLMWVWQLKAPAVVFSDPVRLLTLDYATKLSNAYADTIPAVDNGTIRLKLARMACSLAARTFSCGQNYELVVQPRHVQFAYQLLVNTYNSKALRYDEYSKRIHDAEQVSAAGMLEVTNQLRKLPYSRATVASLRSKTFLNKQELRYIAGTLPDDIDVLLSVLTRNNCITHRNGSQMLITAGFREYLNTVDLNHFPERAPNAGTF